MSAAATAAGYLYASGRLRGRGQREQEEAHKEGAQGDPTSHAEPPVHKPRAERPRGERPRVARPREEVRVAALPEREAKPRRTPVVQYRTRRWKPDE